MTGNSTDRRASGLLERVSKVIAEEILVQKEETVLVACSGGVDSMVLLDVMDRLGTIQGFSVAAAHLDHSLRGREGERDQELVAHFCHSRGILFVGGREDVARFARESDLSLQDAARRIRYSFLRKTLQRIQGNKVATAHHADDQVETVLMRLLRGTGPRGLRGIPLKGNGIYIRPFLGEWKSEIRIYAETMNIPYREDPGNKKDLFHRNVIRNTLLPSLSVYNPAIKEALFNLSLWAVEEGEALDCYIDETLSEVEFKKSGEEITMRRDKLLDFHPFVIKTLIRRAMTEMKTYYGPKSVNFNLALDFVRGAQSGKRMDLPDNIIIGRDFNEIFISKKEEQGDCKEDAVFDVHVKPGWKSLFQSHGITWRIGVDITEKRGIVHLQGNRFRQHFDLQDISPPLRVRRWRPGDMIEPLGMKGRKKVSDLLAEARVARRKRAGIMVLEDSKSVLWVIGVRRGHRGVILKETRKVATIFLESVEEVKG
jgi:tRNA(Ile)-lysidine synthase